MRPTRAPAGTACGGATTSSTAPPSVRAVYTADGPTKRREVIVAGIAPASGGVSRSASGLTSMTAGPGASIGTPTGASTSHSTPSTAMRIPRADGPRTVTSAVVDRPTNPATKALAGAPYSSSGV